MLWETERPSPTPSFFWDAHYKPYPQKFCEMLKTILLLRELHNTAPTPTSSPPKSRRNTNGKNTEQSITMIKKILDLNDSGYTINGICKELGLQYRTVKNVLTLGFKNEASNEKVRNVMKELES